MRRSDIAEALRRCTDAYSMGTDAFSQGTDTFSLGMDARSLGTDAYSRGKDKYTLGQAVYKGRVGPNKIAFVVVARGRARACECVSEVRYRLVTSLTAKPLLERRCALLRGG